MRFTDIWFYFTQTFQEYLAFSLETNAANIGVETLISMQISIHRRKLKEEVYQFLYF